MQRVLVTFSALIACLTIRAESVNFDDTKAGELPKGWVAGVTGDGKTKWTVEADASAPSKPNVLKQSGEGKYPYCVKKDVSIKDGFVETKFKPVSGKEDQAGGLIWRFKDGDNYYIARANALEDNVTIYHTVAGKRVAFKNVETKVSSGEWHTLRVDFKAAHFTVSFDGKAVIEADDSTFSDSGAVGVWTKADSVTLFDDFQHGEAK
ncbi:MAG TPA: family 16 glycoside hydrolase [Planctomycetota bacterium]|nr:family 16 glycoside hydrolase [Planctomycetota bacterium]